MGVRCVNDIPKRPYKREVMITSQESVFNWLKENPNKTPREIAKGVKLCQPAVWRALNRLRATNCIEVLGIKVGEGNRKSKIYGVKE